MKTLNKLIQLLPLAIMLLCIIPAEAKPLLKKKTANVSLRDLVGGSNCYLDCDGYDVRIANDNGTTRVFLKETSSAQEEEITIADLGKENISSWADVDIFVGGGREGGTTLTMTGGKVKGIYAGRATNKDENGQARAEAPGDVTMTITGGTISTAGVDCRIAPYPIQGKVSIYVTNTTLYGGRLYKAFIVGYLDGSEEYQYRPVDNLVIVKCTFLQDETTILNDDQLADIRGGALIQMNDNTVLLTSNASEAEPFVIPSNIYIDNYYDKVLARKYVRNPEYDPEAEEDDGTPAVLTTDNVLNGYVNNQGFIAVKMCNGWTINNPSKLLGSQIVSNNQHHWNETSRASATCISNGSYTKVCALCGKEEITILDALGHNYETVEARPASCVADGHTEYKHCRRCGNNFYPAGYETSKHTDHNWGDWEDCGVQSCVAGERYRKCKNAGCDAQETEHPTQHHWSGWSYTTFSAPCNAYGIKVRTCDNPNCDIEEQIPNETYNKYHHLLHKPAKEPFCNADGYDEYYECAHCGTAFLHLTSTAGIPENEIYDHQGWGTHFYRILPGRPIRPALGHDITYMPDEKKGETVYRAKDPTCIMPAQYYYRCTRCNTWSIETDGSTYSVGTPHGHNYQIESLVVDEDDPFRGVATVGCWYHDEHPEECPMEDFTFYFDRRNVGLSNITQAPTCKDGYGEYTLQIEGTENSWVHVYEAKINPIHKLDNEGNVIEGEYQLHDWDSNGRCTNHEHTGTIGAYAWRAKNHPLENNVSDYEIVGKTFATVADAIADVSDTLNTCAFDTEVELGVFSDMNVSMLNNVASLSNEDYCYLALNLNGHDLTCDEKYAGEGKVSRLYTKNGRFVIHDNVTDVSHERNLMITADEASYDRMVTPGRIVTFAVPLSIPIEKINGRLFRFRAYEDNKFKFEEIVAQDPGGMDSPAGPAMVGPLSSPAGPTMGGAVPGIPYLVKVNQSALPSIRLIEDLTKDEDSYTFNLDNCGYVQHTEWDNELQKQTLIAEHFGSYKTMTIPVSGNDTNTYYGYDSADGAFVKALSGTIKPYRTAFRIPDSYGASAPGRITIQLGEDGDDATEIFEIDVDALAGKGSPIYDINGRHVKAMEAGHIYINNGKKIIK